MKLLSNKDKSDPKNWIDLLEPMEGKLFMIVGNKERMLHHEVTAEEVTIKTDRRTRKLGIYELQKFLEGVEPVNGELVIMEKKQHVDLAVVIENSGMNSIQKMLLDTIKKVDENPDYVHQAHAINNLAKTTLNIAKMQVQLLTRNQEE